MDSRHESLREWGEKIKVHCLVKPKQKLYTSKHDPDPSLVEGSTFPRQAASKPKYVERKNRVYRKPAVPKRKDAPVRTDRTKKNFVMANAICNILDRKCFSTFNFGIVRFSVPTSIKYCAYGCFFAEPQQSQPVDVNKPKPGSLGKLPKYLARVKAEIRDERNAVRDEILLKEKKEREAQRDYD